ncbi:MAG TPA: pentapeptide repeat-containing protein, partial [Phenylobacterium sp.]
MSQPHSTLRPVDPAVLARILYAHRRFLNARTGGQRARLAHADLSCFCLEGADLRDADLTAARLQGAILARADLS